MNRTQAIWLRLILTLSCLQAAILITAFRGKLGALAIVLVLSAAVICRIRIETK